LVAGIRFLVFSIVLVIGFDGIYLDLTFGLFYLGNVALAYVFAIGDGIYLDLTVGLGLSYLGIGAFAYVFAYLDVLVGLGLFYLGIGAFAYVLAIGFDVAYLDVLVGLGLFYPDIGVFAYGLAIGFELSTARTIRILFTWGFFFPLYASFTPRGYTYFLGGLLALEVSPTLCI